MISIILDTNILHQEGLSSRNMQLLARLAASGELQVCIPELVYREFVSKRIVDSVGKLQSTHAALAELVRMVNLHDPIGEELVQLQAQVRALQDRIVPAIEGDFHTWANATNVVRLKFDPHQITEVLDDYFAGTGAYRKPKSREDIPDAIVSSCIRSLAKSEANVHVVLKDGTFKKHLQSVKELTVSDDLKEFFALGDVRTLLQRLDRETVNVEELKGFLAGTLFRERLSAFLKIATKLFDAVYVESEGVEGAENLGFPTWGASVNFAQAQSVSDIAFGEVTCIDQGHFSLEIAIKTIAEIHFAADYGDYLSIPSPRCESVEEVSMNSDGISELHERRPVVLRGHVEVMFDPNLTVQQLEVHSQYLTTAQAPDMIQLDVDRASIL